MDKHSDICEKTKEIVSSLSKRTGVEEEQVAKILDTLGLDKSLYHRQYVDKLIGTNVFQNVDATTIRLSSDGPAL